jgi:hypothetical protein
MYFEVIHPESSEGKDKSLCTGILGKGKFYVKPKERAEII